MIKSCCRSMRAVSWMSDLRRMDFCWGREKWLLFFHLALRISWKMIVTFCMNCLGNSPLRARARMQWRWTIERRRRPWLWRDVKEPIDENSENKRGKVDHVSSVVSRVCILWWGGHNTHKWARDDEVKRVKSHARLEHFFLSHPPLSCVFVDFIALKIFQVNFHVLNRLFLLQHHHQRPVAMSIHCIDDDFSSWPRTEWALNNNLTLIWVRLSSPCEADFNLLVGLLCEDQKCDKHRLKFDVFRQRRNFYDAVSRKDFCSNKNSIFSSRDEPADIFILTILLIFIIAFLQLANSLTL